MYIRLTVAARSIGPLFLLGCALWSTTSRAAAASPPATYQRLVPQNPNPDLEAKVIEGDCKSLVDPNIATRLSGCTALPPATLFCTDPLNLSQPRPATSVLNTLAGGQCPAAGLAAAAANVHAKAAGALFSVGWQDTVIQGIATFLVGRAKAEALAAAAERFQEGICGEASGKKLFPLTCTLLADADPYSVPVSWTQVKIAAEADLYDLPLHVLDLELPVRTETLKDAPLLLYTSVDLSEQFLAHKTSVISLLIGMQSSYKYAIGQCDADPTACALLAAGLVTDVVLPDFQPALVSDSAFAKIATRVVLDQAIAIGLLSSTTVAAPFVQGFETVMEKNLLPAVGSFVAQGLTLGKSKAPKDLEAFDQSVAQIVDALRTTVQPIFAVPADSLQQIQTLMTDWQELFKLSIDDKDYLKATLRLFMIVDALEADATPAWVHRYLPPLAELAQAKTADDVTSVLDNLAAPVGSYRSKRGSGNRKLAINGYLGLQGGWEWLGGMNVPAARSLQGGVFAPVGIESDWGFGKSGSLGIFLSVLDLGAVVSFRDSGDSQPQGSGASASTISNQPQVGLSQVFSPGLYGLLGIPCTPLVFGVGAALTPELRRVTFADGTTTEATALRVGAWLAIDITIFPF